MTRQTFQLAALGGFAMLGLLSMSVVVVMLARQPTWLTARNSYTVIFDDAPGLQPGSPVRRSGVRVGEVSAVTLDSETGQVRVTLQLDRTYIPRAYEEPTIAASLLTGDTAIDFLPGKVEPGQEVDRSPIAPGSEIEGHTFVDARRLLDQASDVLPNARSSLAQIRESVEKFDKLSPRIDEAFREFAELARAGRELVPELRQTNDRVRELLVTQINPAQPGPPGADGNPQRAGLRTTSEKVAQAADEMQIAARSATRLIERLDDIVVENRKKFTEVIDGLNRVLGPENQDALTRTIRNFAEITENVKPASKRLDSAMEKAEEAISRLGDTAVNVDTMIKELRPTTAAMAERGPNLVKNLDEAAAKFNALLTTMNERTPRLLISLEETTTRLNRSLGDVSELVLAVGRSEGTIAKLLGDPALYNNLDCFTASLAKLGPRLDHILRDVEVFADKIARHPEQIGVRGAIRPDSGLKEGAPSVPPRPRLLP